MLQHPIAYQRKELAMDTKAQIVVSVAALAAWAFYIGSDDHIASIAPWITAMVAAVGVGVYLPEIIRAWRQGQ